MREPRLYPNKLGTDPAVIAQQDEPQHGYVGFKWRFFAPSPKAARLMEECLAFATLWCSNSALSADRRWKRDDATHKLKQISNHLRELNIQLLEEYLPSLRGQAKIRARYTIVHLKTLQSA